MESDDLRARLSRDIAETEHLGFDASHYRECRDLIDHLLAEIARKDEALRPFADEADRRPWIDTPSLAPANIGGCALTNADLLRARTALAAPSDTPTVEIS